MRRGTLLIVAALLASSAFSQRTDLAGLKFCIDPGHGGYNEADDRHVVPDPGTDFWESESNFRKALLLDTLLRERGATVLLTRYTNDYPGNDEPSLTARVAFANANNVDWFHSIHSNAVGNGLQSGTAINYTLMLVREKRSSTDPAASTGNGMGVPERAESWTVAGVMSPAIRTRLRTNSNMTYLDWTFYGGTNGGYSLGVLRGLLMPGELSEGSMHDYAPETRRLMNNSYRKMEAYALRNSFLQFFGVPADTMGIIAGIQNEFGTGKNINLSRIRIAALNRVYTGDAYNNGFYMFDKVPPGSYTLRFDTPGYSTDSVVVNVTTGSVSFVDRSLLSYGRPAVLATSPVNLDGAYDASKPITVTFSKPMDTASVRKAFTITPAVPGAFVWSSANSILAFDPDSLLTFFKTYTVRIDTTARSIDGLALDANGDGTADPLQLTFTTKFVDVIPPQLIALTPAALDTVATTSHVINMTFGERLKQSSITLSNIVVQEIGGSLLGRTFEYYETADKGAVVMYLPTGLKEGRSYRLRISGVSDLAGNVIPTSSPILLTFSVGFTAYTYRTLDSLGQDWSPFKVPVAIGAGAVLSMVSSPKLGGMNSNSGAARLDYSWDSAASHSRIDILVDSTSALAATRWSRWGHVLQAFCYGDGSGNVVRLAVRDSLPDGTVQRVLGPADTLSWVGWRLLEWDIENAVLPEAQPGPSGIMRFDGISVIPVPGAATIGQIGLDQIQIAERVVNGVATEDPDVPLTFAFHQNYPNPFNPSTTMSFDTPLAGTVSIIVYDLLGCEVQRLVDAVVDAGRHAYQWDGRDRAGIGVPSGVYFARLTIATAGEGRTFTAVRKILLTK
jgi:N-acetylmuramoyl-L-alanine amidase